MRIRMVVAVASACLLAGCGGQRPPAAEYRCGPVAAASGADGAASPDGPPIDATVYRLLEVHRGDSMGAPAQSVAYRLIDAGDGSVVLRCSRGFLKGLLVCSRRLGDDTEIGFRFDRTTGEYRIRRPTDAGRAEELGRCVPV